MHTQFAAVFTCMIQKHVMLYNGEFCVRNTKQMCHIMILVHSIFMVKIESNKLQFNIFSCTDPNPFCGHRDLRRVAPADCWMGTQRVQWKGSFLGWFNGLVVPVQEIVVYLGCSKRPGRKYFFPHRTLQYFNSLPPRKLGRQPCWVACLLLCVSGSSVCHLCVCLLLRG